jgi:hypothetical protein
LTNGERIVAVSITCQPACVISLTDIPAGWNVSLGGADSACAEISGSIAVGAAALSKIDELPKITIRPYIDEATQIVSQATLQIETYPEGAAPSRQVTIATTNARPQQSAAPLPRAPRAGHSEGGH